MTPDPGHAFGTGRTFRRSNFASQLSLCSLGGKEEKQPDVWKPECKLMCLGFPQVSQSCMLLQGSKLRLERHEPGFPTHPKAGSSSLTFLKAKMDRSQIPWKVPFWKGPYNRVCLRFFKRTALFLKWALLGSLVPLPGRCWSTWMPGSLGKSASYPQTARTVSPITFPCWPTTGAYIVTNIILKHISGI